MSCRTISQFDESWFSVLSAKTTYWMELYAHCFLSACSDSFFELSDLSGINEELNADFECICVFSC